MADRQKITSKDGKLDLKGVGYSDPRLLKGETAEAVAELDVHVRTLRSISTILPRVADLVIQPRTDESEAMLLALWTGAVVRYARCFDTTNRNALKAAEVFPEEELQTAHTEAFEMRSKHLAHDVNGFRFCAIGVERLPDGTMGRLIRAFAEHLPSLADLHILTILAERAYIYAEEKRVLYVRDLKKNLSKMLPGDFDRLAAMEFTDLHKIPVKSARRSSNKK